MAGLAPALLLALFGAWCGTYAWGAASPAGAVAAASLLGVLFWAGAPWRDPLRLGGAGQLLPAALWIAVAGSAWASPVPRAGRVAVVLLPAFLALPGAVERCWRREADRRRGLRLLAVAVAAISLWSLLDWMVLGSPRAAMPLGHHNLLAAWLVLLLPLAVLAGREPGPWRWSGLAAGALAAVAILASRSLAGFVALGLQAVLGFGRARQRRWWGILLVLGLLVSLVQLPRLLRIAAGEDVSAQARASYLAAGWEGFLSRPFVGWGPGSVAWTSAAFLQPAPRVRPWGEAVGELHSLPVQTAYELGLPGALLALATAVLFFARRTAERQEGRDPALVAAGLLGLGGGAVMSLGSGALAAAALPVAAVVAAGAALAGSGRGKARPESSWPVRIYAVGALLLLFPLELARWRYDRAVAAESAGRGEEAAVELTEAARLDPVFPLYPMRLALLKDRQAAGHAEAAGMALQAAESGRAVPSLWLVAGILGYSADRPWTGEALDRACAFDPLNPFPPFYRVLAEPAAPKAAAYGAHALLAEPRLAAATFWERHPGLYAQTLEKVRAWPGVDAGWKEALLAAAPRGPGQGPVSRLALEIDTVPRESLSLAVFRRRPWPVWWPLVQLRQSALERLTLPPAAASPTTSGRTFASVPCRDRSGFAHGLLIP